MNRIVFRTDASVQIGSGHVMRCITLAEEVRKRGVDVRFICRELEGNLCDFIGNKGFAVSRLSATGAQNAVEGAFSSSWDQCVGACWEEDAEETKSILEGSCWDWLVVDHYALDVKWESLMRECTKHMMVIDDLANRKHDADVLLDQNYENPLHKAYPSLLHGTACCLLGTRYSLVRPEFSQYREESLARRNGDFKRLLVFMGGSDPDNDTAKVLNGLGASVMNSIQVDVVLGASNPHHKEIKEICARLPSATLHVQTPHMAKLMTLADCAINAGGSTAWERCTLGLPGLVVIQSDDQIAIAKEIDRVGGHRLLGRAEELTCIDYANAIEALESEHLNQMSEISSTLCDGKGAARVADQLFDSLGRLDA